MKKYKIKIEDSTVIFEHHILPPCGFDTEGEEFYRIISIDPPLAIETNIEQEIWEAGFGGQWEPIED